MCPVGSHVVRGHERICKSGTSTWVDAHVRKNRGRIQAGLLTENLLHLFWNSGETFPPLGDLDGYEGLGSEFDAPIQFWLKYWKSREIVFPGGLTPLVIKALIAKESTFNPKVPSPDKKSTAMGLMQITDQAMRVLGGHPNKAKWIEMREHLIHIVKADKLDPVVNIAIGIRLLGHKYKQIPEKYPKDLKSTLMGYYSWGEGGQNYAEKILEIHAKSLARQEAAKKSK